MNINLATVGWAVFTVAVLRASTSDLARIAEPTPDVVIVGAGIAGLSAALEAATAGASVIVVEMSTVGGGHAILSNGAVSMIATPLQEAKGIADSPALAEKDGPLCDRDAVPRVPRPSAAPRTARCSLTERHKEKGIPYRENQSSPARMRSFR